MERLRLAAVIAAIALLLGACSSGAKTAVSSGPAQAASTTSTVAGSTLGSSTTASSVPDRLIVVEHDFALATSTSTVASGNVTLNITNQGPSSHELLAFRTDLPEDQLPLGVDGRIKEDALPKALDTETDLTPGSQRSVTVPLTPGRYVLVCNLQNHYKMGMHLVVTVT